MICSRCSKLEREQVIAALAKHDGNVLKVALELGVGVATVYRKIKKYGWERGGEAANNGETKIREDR